MSEPNQYTGHINCQKCGKTHWIGAQCELNQNEIPTPRADAAEMEFLDNWGSIVGDPISQAFALKTLSDKFRQLERELTELRGLADLLCHNLVMECDFESTGAKKSITNYKSFLARHTL